VPINQPELRPVLRDGESIKLADLVAPTTFYAKVIKNGSDYPLLISKPTESAIKIFTARCPHQGNILNLVRLGEINCDLHGAKFDSSTGKVLDGPTIQNLERYEAVDREGFLFITL
jgi:nitrite reductase/ring-hydroxylating ferredoxin subunit